MFATQAFAQPAAFTQYNTMPQMFSYMSNYQYPSMPSSLSSSSSSSRSSKRKRASTREDEEEERHMAHSLKRVQVSRDEVRSNTEDDLSPMSCTPSSPSPSQSPSASAPTIEDHADGSTEQRQYNDTDDNVDGEIDTEAYSISKLGISKQWEDLLQQQKKRNLGVDGADTEDAARWAKVFHACRNGKNNISTTPSSENRCQALVLYQSPSSTSDSRVPHEQYQPSNCTSSVIVEDLSEQARGVLPRLSVSSSLSSSPSPTPSPDDASMDVTSTPPLLPQQPTNYQIMEEPYNQAGAFDAHGFNGYSSTLLR